MEEGCQTDAPSVVVGQAWTGRFTGAKVMVTQTDNGSSKTSQVHSCRRQVRRRTGAKSRNEVNAGRSAPQQGGVEEMTDKRPDRGIREEGGQRKQMRGRKEQKSS